LDRQRAIALQAIKEIKRVDVKLAARGKAPRVIFIQFNVHTIFFDQKKVEKDSRINEVKS
jgi:hypothetical protein